MPRHLPEELLDGLVQHWTAPDHRGIIAGHEPDGHHLHAVLLGRHDPLSIGRELLRLQPHHERHIRSVHVAVQNPDAAAAFRERQCEIDRDRGLPDAAFSRADGDDVLDARQWRPSRLGRRDGAYAGRHLHLDIADPWQGPDGRDRLVAQLILHRTRGSGELDRE